MVYSPIWKTLVLFPASGCRVKRLFNPQEKAHARRHDKSVPPPQRDGKRAVHSADR
jgi:hypothetical protein